MTRRLFISVPVPNTISTTLLSAASHAQNTRGVRITKRENIHLTLSFLGDREEEDLAKIKDQIAEIVSLRDKFSLVFRGYKTIFKDGKPKMIWAIFHDCPEFTDLSLNLSHSLNGDLENEPIPHITLARLRSAPGQRINIPKMDIIKPFKIEVDKVELWESSFTDKRIEYSVLSGFDLMR